MTDFDHHPFYCEENIWRLCARAEIEADDRYVLLISNAIRKCAFQWMRTAEADEIILWDYHVVLLTGQPWNIWDLDTRLPCPLPAMDYLHFSFNREWPADVLPRFRMLRADTYRRVLSSDRSHMSPQNPPPWPPIIQGSNNLLSLIDMSVPNPGRVYSLDRLIARLSTDDHQ